MNTPLINPNFERRLLKGVEMEASSRCPICGVDTPHEHDGATVKEYQEDELYWGRINSEKHQKLIAKRQAVDAKFMAEFQRRIDEATAAKTRYEAACPCCRIARVSDKFITDTIGTLVVYEYGWKEGRGGDTVHCPECGACLWDKS